MRPIEIKDLNIQLSNICTLCLLRDQNCQTWIIRCISTRASPCLVGSYCMKTPKVIFQYEMGKEDPNFCKTIFSRYLKMIEEIVTPPMLSCEV